MRQSAEKYRAEIIALEIMPDEVQGIVEGDPQFGIQRFVKNLKGVSSHPLRKEFRTWKSRYPHFGRIAISYPRLAGHPWRSQSNMLKIRKTFKYRLYPNRKQRESLLATLEVCRDLYNDALQERREAWRLCRKSITFAMQSGHLPACKAADAAMRGVYSQVPQDVLPRGEKTYQAFF